MDGIAERGVRFTLNVVAGQSAKTELDKFSKSVSAVNDTVAQSAKAATSSIATTMSAASMGAAEVNSRIEAILSERAALQSANNAKLAQLDAQRLAAADKFATEFQAIGMQLFNNEIDATTAASMVESFSQAAMEAKEQYDAFQESLTSKAAKESEKRTDKELAALKKRQAVHVAETKKMVDAELKEIERGVQKEADARKQAALAAKRMHDAQMASYDTLTNKSKNSSRQLLIQFGEINESVMRFARGLVMVGLAGEDDLGKLTKSLVKLQGYFDFFSGGVKTLTKMNEMYRHMTDAIKAAAAAQAALNLAQGMDPSGKVIRDPLNKDKTKRGGGSTVGASSGSLIAGQAVGGGVEALLLAALTGNKGLTAAASWGGRVALSIASKAGPIGIAIASAFLTYKGIKSLVTGDTKFYEGPLNPFMYAKGKDLRNSEEWTRKMGGKANAVDLAAPIVETGKQAKNREDNKAIDELTAKKVKAELELKKSANERMRATLEEQKPLEARKTIAAELAKAYKAIHRSEAGAHAEVIEWQKQRLANEKTISSEKASAARNAANAAKSELDSVIARQKALQEGVMSAAERFATLEPDKQRSVLDIRNRLRRGDKTLTTEEVQSARGFGEETDARISKLLQGRAMGSGFGAFVQESSKEIAALERTKKKLELEVKQKFDFAVRIEADYDALSKKIAVEIDKQQRAENVKLVAKVSAEIAKLKANLQQRNKGVTPP